jgi:Rad3-related DNA helicase
MMLLLLLLLLLPAACSYRDDLGHAIVNFARVVPDGLLVFFPAYSLLQACIDHWKTNSGTSMSLTVINMFLSAAQHTCALLADESIPY